MKRADIKEKGIIHIPSSVRDKIDYICKKISSVEWSGRIFYKIVEGSLDDISTVRIELVDVYLEDKGSTGYTEYTASEDIMDLFDAHPHLEDCRFGMIHSHNNGGVYFSGTDLDELKENHYKYEVYLSIVVNNNKDVAAKIAFPATQKVTVTGEENTSITFKFKGDPIIRNYKKNLDSVNFSNLMLIADMDVEEESITKIKDEFFIKRVDEIIRDSEKSYSRQCSVYGSYYGDYYENDHTSYGKSSSYLKDKKLTPSETYFPSEVDLSSSASNADETNYEKLYNETDDDFEIDVSDAVKIVKGLLSKGDLKKNEKTSAMLLTLGRYYSEDTVKSLLKDGVDKLDDIVEKVLNIKEMNALQAFTVIDACIGYIDVFRLNKIAVPVCTELIEQLEQKEDSYNGHK